MSGWKIPFILTNVLIIIFVLSIITPDEVSSDELRIVVLVGSTESPYKEVLAGFQNYLLKQKIPVKCDIYKLEGEATDKSQVFQEIKKNKISLILTIGTNPTTEALKVFNDIPIVATLLISKDVIKNASNITGIILDFPIETQFYWIKSFLPQAKKIGVMYNSSENQGKIRQAEVLAREMGLELIPVRVYTPNDIPNALKTLAKDADVLWGINDPVVFNPLTAKHILLFSFRNRIPFCGLSATWVMAGALYALEYDFYDIGVQCGENALEIIRSSKANSLPPSLPRKLLYILNLRTARHMKINIQEKYVHNAHKIFDE